MSSFASLCPREEVLVGVENLTRKGEITADLALIFDHGHALHWALQNRVLPAAGVLRGQWRCHGCGARAGAPNGSGGPLEWAVARPPLCPACGEEAFTFEEYVLRDEEYRVQGHSDGFLEIEGLPGLGVFEGKSINPRGAWEVRDTPKLDHVIQTQMYMWLTGAQWGVIVYWDKAGSGMASLIEHMIDRDEETIDFIKLTIKSIWAGIDDGGPLPSRICETATCKRAEACSVTVQCFERPNESQVDADG